MSRRWYATLLVFAGCVLAVAGVVAVVAAAFALSFDAIKAVGVAAGVNPDIAWMLPVSIDGAMLVSTITAIMLRFFGRPVWYPWLVVVSGVVISVACNAAHASLRDALTLDAGAAQAVSAIPALTLALSVHLLITLAVAVLAEPTGQGQLTDTPPVPAPVSAPPGTMAWLPVMPEETPDGGPSGVVLPTADARRLAAVLRAEDPDMPAAQIADRVGRSERTIKRWQAESDKPMSHASSNGTREPAAQ